MQSFSKALRNLTCNHHGLRELRSLDGLDERIPPDDSVAQDAVVEITIDLIDGDFEHVNVLHAFVYIHICNEDGRYVSTMIEEIPLPLHMNSQQCSLTRVFDESRGYTSANNNTQRSNTTHLPFSWGQHIVMNISYRHVLNASTVILFEVLDAKSSTDLKDNKQIAWGFLKPFSQSKECNVGEKLNNSRTCRLQLFKYQYDSPIVRHQAKKMDLLPNSKHIPQVFLQYLRLNRLHIDQTLYVKIGPTKLDPIEEKVHGDDNDDSLRNKGDNKNIISFDSFSPTSPKRKLLMRNDNEKCLLPDIVHKLNGGSETLEFSASGDYLAVASNKTYIYDVESTHIVAMSQFHSSHINSLVWSDNDMFLASSSNDGTIAILCQVATKLNTHCGEDTQVIFPNVVFSIPPPSIPCCLAFVSAMGSGNHDSISSRSVLISACDNSLKLWNIQDETCVGELGGEEQHFARVTAITKELSSSRVYSGDSIGDIIVWKPRESSNLNFSITGNDFVVLHRIGGMRSFGGRAISNLDFNASGQRRLLITTKNEWDGNLFIYDFDCQLAMPVCSESNMNRHSFSKAVFSPDGKLVVGGTIDGKIMFLNSAGIMKRVRNCSCRVKEEYKKNLTNISISIGQCFR